jgi:hypothetical protein
MNIEDTQHILKNLGIVNYIIDDAGRVNVNGDVNLSGMDLAEIPVKFHIVKGNFIMNGNKLKSLRNAPNIVYGNVSFAHNELESLLWAPQEIEKTFNVTGNRLKSLKGGPIKVGLSFICERNTPLKSVRYSPNCNFVGIGSGIPLYEIEIHNECVKLNIWDSTATVKHNLKTLLSMDSSFLQKKWKLIEKVKNQIVFNSLTNLNF